MIAHSQGWKIKETMEMRRFEKKYITSEDNFSNDLMIDKF